MPGVNSNLPKVSVILPVYNSEKFLKDTLESIISQSFSDFEVLAVFDNGTTDSSPAILKEYALNDSRIRLLDAGGSRGLVKGLNFAVRASEGEYLARIDADDICMEDRLQKQADYLDDHSDIAILAGCVDIFGDISSARKYALEDILNKTFDDSTLIPLLLRINCLPHPTIMLRRDCAVSLKGYNEDFKEAEDLELWLRALAKGYKIRKLDEKLTRLRMHNNSKSALSTDDASLLRYVMRARINFIRLLYNDSPLRYLIWGANSSGALISEEIRKLKTNFIFKGFIDLNAPESFEGTSVCPSESLDKAECDYLFISRSCASSTLLEELSKKKFSYIKDYLIL